MVEIWIRETQGNWQYRRLERYTHSAIGSYSCKRLADGRHNHSATEAGSLIFIKDNCKMK